MGKMKHKHARGNALLEKRQWIVEQYPFYANISHVANVWFLINVETFAFGDSVIIVSQDFNLIFDGKVETIEKIEPIVGDEWLKNANHKTLSATVVCLLRHLRNHKNIAKGNHRIKE